MLLSDGTIIKGKGFGAPKRVTGEAVFNTGMVGYTESLTDPAYCGQILCLTYPLVGNYGSPLSENTDTIGLLVNIFVIRVAVPMSKQSI